MKCVASQSSSAFSMKPRMSLGMKKRLIVDKGKYLDSWNVEIAGWRKGFPPQQMIKALITCMRRSYFDVIDVIVESINTRFGQKDLSLIKIIEQILLRSMFERGFSIDSLTHALIGKEKLRTHGEHRRYLQLSAVCPRNSARTSIWWSSCTIPYPSHRPPVNAHSA